MHPTPTPPRRSQPLYNELGLRQTPPASSATFQALGGCGDILIIGLGPDPTITNEFIQSIGNTPDASIFYIECLDFASQMGGAWKRDIPAAWRELDQEAALSLIGGGVQNILAQTGLAIILYLPGLRLFPSFFGPLFGAAWAKFPPCAGAVGASEESPSQDTATKGNIPRHPPGKPAIHSVTLVGSEKNLLHRELALAFTEQGIKVQAWNVDEEGANTLPETLAPPEDCLGDLFFSVNFSGLDAYGATYHYLRAKGRRVAVWCVDNPWHLLSGLRAPYWKELILFVTDKSFLPDLKAHGAKYIYHLPLAASQDMLAQMDLSAPSPDDAAYLHSLAPLVFVGRTAFPGRDKFFAAQHPPKHLLDQAFKSMENGARPDFLYWLIVLNLYSLWPGYKSRLAGFAAEECSRRRRTLCANAAMPQNGNNTPGLTIFGDMAWQEELKAFTAAVPDLRGTVDYYTELPALYHAARLVLNVASLLLPAGLNQRHFDVWAAGGAQICDASPGLDIFPEDLTRPITFQKPQEIPTLAEKLLGDAALLRGLKHDWRALIAAKHTYDCRALDILNALEASA